MVMGRPLRCNTPLARLLNQRGINGRDLVIATGIPEHTLQHYLHEPRAIPVKYLARIAHALSVHPSVLIEDGAPDA